MGQPAGAGHHNCMVLQRSENQETFSERGKPMAEEKKRGSGKKSPETQGEPRGAELSLVMIARDEEANLPRALISAAPWVDEIILVDTGSTDRTVEIARSFGARVYHHPWQNDFSLHRNQSLAYAAGKWRLVLDADEELDQPSAAQLKKLMQNPRAMAYRLRVDDLLPGGGVSTHHGPRLLRDSPEIRYTRQVHNQVHVPGPVLDCPVRIIHHGYNLDPQAMAKRHGRRVSMIKSWAQGEPDNWQAHYYLAQTLVSRPESVEESLADGLKALELARGQGAAAPDLSRIYLPLLQAFSLLNRHQEVLRHARDWAALVPGHPDPELFMARANYALDRPEQVCRHAEKAWYLHQRYLENPAALANFQVTTGGTLPILMVIWLVAEWKMQNRARAVEILRAIGGLDNPRQAMGLLLGQAREKGLADLSHLLQRPAKSA